MPKSRGGCQPFAPSPPRNPGTRKLPRLGRGEAPIMWSMGNKAPSNARLREGRGGPQGRAAKKGLPLRLNAAADPCAPAEGREVGGTDATLSPQPHRGGGYPPTTAEGSNPVPVAQEAIGPPHPPALYRRRSVDRGKADWEAEQLGLRGEKGWCEEERRTVDWEGRRVRLPGPLALAWASCWDCWRRPVGGKEAPLGRAAC